MTIGTLDSRAIALVCWLRDLRRRADTLRPAQVRALPPGCVYLRDLPQALRDLADSLEAVRERVEVPL